MNKSFRRFKIIGMNRYININPKVIKNIKYLRVVIDVNNPVIIRQENIKSWIGVSYSILSIIRNAIATENIIAGAIKD